MIAQMSLMCCNPIRLVPHNIQWFQEVTFVNPVLNGKEAGKNSKQDDGKFQRKNICRCIGFRQGNAEGNGADHIARFAVKTPF